MRLVVITAILLMLGLGALVLVDPGDASDSKAPTVAADTTASPPAAAVHDRRELRDALMRAANRLENSPCDKRLREPLRAAILAFVDDAHESRKYPNEDEALVVLNAVNVGVVAAQEIAGLEGQPPGYVSMRYVDGDKIFRVSVRGSRPFTCDIGGATEGKPRRVVR
jgi:hypothetical protein